MHGSRSARWGAWLIVSGCGPDVLVGVGDDAASSTSTPAASSSGGAEIGGAEVGSTAAADTTGAVDDTGSSIESVCWEATWARAGGVIQAWSDGTNVLAATPESLLAFDGTTWREQHLDVHVVGLAATAPGDAWVLTDTGVSHWDGATLTTAFEEPTSDMVAVAVDGGGRPWLVSTPVDQNCGFLCAPYPSDVRVRDVDGTWRLLDPPDIAASTLAFVDGEAWLGGIYGELLHSVDDSGAWETVSTPLFLPVDHIWGLGDDLLVSSSDLWRVSAGVWTTELEAPTFSEATAILETPAGPFMLWRTQVAGEIQRTGELRRLGPDGWQTVVELEADSDLITLSDGRLVAFGDERGQLVQTIDDPAGTPAVDTAYLRGDLGGITDLSILGDGTLIGMSPSAISVETDGAWTSSDDNSIYGQFAAAWGPTLADVTVASWDTSASGLWRFDGAAFSPIDLGAAEDTAIRLYDVLAVDDRPYVVGSRALFFQPTQPFLLSRDEGVWSELEAPDHDCVGNCASSLALDGDVLWMAGERVWQRTDAWIDVTPDDGDYFTSLTAGSHGVWLVASSPETRRLLQRTGDAWIDHTDAMPISIDGTTQIGAHIVDDGANVWVAWGASLSRYDGETWTVMPGPDEGEWSAEAMVARPGVGLIVHTGRRIATGTPCPG